jgi:hypothetical protein
MSTAIACLATLAAVSVASAQTTTNLSLWTASDCAGQREPSLNSTPGNATIYVAPTDQNATLAVTYSVPAATLAYDRATIYIMGDVGCRGDGIGNETVASLGLDIRKAFAVTVPPGGDSNALTATAWSIGNTAGTGAGQTGSAQNPWSGTNNGAAGQLNQAGGLLVSNARAVAVPGTTTDNLWRGYNPNTGFAAGACGTGGRFNVGGANGHYRMAKLTVAANTTGSTVGHAPTSFNLFMRVGPLKIARVYLPTATNGGAPEGVSFGYNGAARDAFVSGSTVAAESANPDGFVIIRRKGDFGSADPNTGNTIPVPDGAVGSDDTPLFLAAFGTTNPEQVFLGDFGSADPNTGNAVPVRDCQVGSDDTTLFLQAFGS